MSNYYDTAGDAAVGSLDGTTNKPVKVGGTARTTNPTKVSDSQRVGASFDVTGRQISIPYQVRDLTATARASLSTGTETTLFAGTASEFHDLIHVSFSNSSTAATTVDIRDATGGGIIKTFDIPAAGSVDAAFNFPVPIPQNVAADTWTADLPDITGTTVLVDALFVKNV